MNSRGPVPIPWPRWALAIVLVAVAALPVLLRYLVFWPMDQWQVDVEVYRQAGESVLVGRPIYQALTEAPQLLPFTYPPFAALLAVPLALMPFGAAGWAWAIVQVIANTTLVWYAAHQVLPRAGRWFPYLLAGLTAVVLWLHPVSDGIRFGQVNVFLVLFCLMDLRAPRPEVLRRVPPGVLVGVAMAIKLTPGVFVIHYLVCRRWKEAATAVTTAVLITVGSWLVLPQGSFAFWGGALQDPNRLGPNAGTSNQSIRGMLLRIGPADPGGTVLWLVLAVVVAVVGFWLARRFWRAGNSVAEVGTVGLVACLISPVSWIHHYHWIVPVIFALLGAASARDRPRLYAAGLVTVWFLLQMPWWGNPWVSMNSWLRVPGNLLQNADLIGGLVALSLLWWLAHRTGAGLDGRPGEAGAAGRGGGAGGSGADDAGDLERGEQREEQTHATADAAQGR